MRNKHEKKTQKKKPSFLFPKHMHWWCTMCWALFWVVGLCPVHPCTHSQYKAYTWFLVKFVEYLILLCIHYWETYSAVAKKRAGNFRPGDSWVTWVHILWRNLLEVQKVGVMRWCLSWVLAKRAAMDLWKILENFSIESRAPSKSCCEKGPYWEMVDFSPYPEEN